MADFIGRWTSKGITHAVFRVTNSSPFHTFCEITLKPKSHRSVRADGVVNCISCARHDRAERQAKIERMQRGLCAECSVPVIYGTRCAPCSSKRRRR